MKNWWKMEMDVKELKLIGMVLADFGWTLHEVFMCPCAEFWYFPFSVSFNFNARIFRVLRFLLLIVDAFRWFWMVMQQMKVFKNGDKSFAVLLKTILMFLETDDVQKYELPQLCEC